MKKIFLFSFLAIVLVGCGPTPRELELQDRYKNHIVSMEGFDSSQIIDFVKRKNTNGLLEFSVSIDSKVSGELYYKIDWIDKDGFVLRDAINENYRTIYLNKNRISIINKVAPNKNAVDVKIYLTKKETK